MTGEGSGAAGPPAGTHSVPLSHAGRDRPYLLHVPPAPSARPLPLVVELHGRGIGAVTFDSWTGFAALSDEAGFALAMPGAIGALWNDGRYGELLRGGPDDVGYLLAVIDDACARLPVDGRRVYVAGMSNGATMAGRLACEHAARLAAIAQVAGTAAACVAERCRPTAPLPILEIHGTGDDAAPYAGGRRRGLRARLMIRRAAGPSVGVEEWARLWSEVNGAAGGPRSWALPPDTTVRAWRGPTPASDVVFYRIAGGGHTWPGNRQLVPRLLFGRTSRAFDATRVIWDFFAAHAREA